MRIAEAVPLEIRPEDWPTFRFTHRLSAFDLLAENWESRLDSVFPAPRRCLRALGQRQVAVRDSTPIDAKRA